MPMRNRKNTTARAFTLIELLVVIAIIAILAAILFPVFAAAKVAAKQTAIISNAKQMALAQLIYATDNEDHFTPSMGFRGGWNMPSWVTLQMPYMKTVGIVMDSFTPAQITDNPFVLNSQWAMPSRLGASDWCGANCTFGYYNTMTLDTITNGETWGREGVGGVWKDTSKWMNWASYGYKSSYPSLSTTAVARPADTILIHQGNTADNQWHQVWNPDEAARWWGDAVFNLWGNKNATTGPSGRIRASGDFGRGVYPTSMWQPTPETGWPDGLCVQAGTDGHVWAEKWTSLVGGRVGLPGDGNGHMKYFSPSID